MYYDDDHTHTERLTVSDNLNIFHLSGARCASVGSKLINRIASLSFTSNLRIVWQKGRQYTTINWFKHLRDANALLEIRFQPLLIVYYIVYCCCNN